MANGYSNESIESMKPIFKITGLSAAANDRVLSIQVEDNAGIEGDNVTITIDDRDYEMEWIPPGTRIDVFLGYDKTGLIHIGHYEVDECQHKQAQAAEVVIKANAQYHSEQSGIKKPRTQPWDEQSLASITGTIAARNGYAPEIDGQVAGFYYDHLDQDNESDIHFLTRLAEKHDAYVKCQDGKLLLKARENTNGAVHIERNTQTQWTQVGWRTIGTSLSATINLRQQYKSVRTQWVDKETGELKYEIEGSGEPQFDVRRSYENHGVAKMAAQKKLKRLGRGEGQIDSLDLPGDPNIRAEMELTLSGFRPEICELTWIITRVSHTFDGGGYKTSLSADLKND